MSSVSFSVSVVAIVGLGRSKIFLMELKRKWPPAINRLSHLMIHIYNHLAAVFVIVVIAVVFVVAVVVLTGLVVVVVWKREARHHFSE